MTNKNIPQSAGDTKPTKRPVWSYLTNNFWLKVFSLIFALLLWSYVINENDPERAKTFSNQLIYITGSSALLNNKLIPMEDLSTKLPDVDVTISVKHTKYSTASAANIEVSVDLSRITSTGMHTVPVRVVSNNSDITVLSYSPSTVDVTIDELASSIVPLKLVTSGVLSSQLYRGEPSFTPETVQISGPETYVSKIAQAQVFVDLSQMTDGYSASMPFSYVDAQGNKISSTSITSSTDVALVDMNIKTLKTVDIDYISALINQDKLAEGYELKAANISFPTVILIGNADKLQQVEKLAVSPVDLTGMKDSVKGIHLEPVLPEGVEIYNPKAITLDLTVGEKTISENFNVDITFINTPSSLKVRSASSTVTVTVTGSYSAVKGTSAKNIKAIVDLTGLHAGLGQLKSVSPRLVNPQYNVTMDVNPGEIYIDLIPK